MAGPRVPFQNQTPDEDNTIVTSQALAKFYEQTIAEAKKVLSPEQFKVVHSRLERQYKPSIESNKQALHGFLSSLQEALATHKRLNEMDKRITEEQKSYEKNREDSTAHVPASVDMAKMGPAMVRMMGIKADYITESGKRVSGGRMWKDVALSDIRKLDPYHREKAIEEILGTPSPVHTFPFHRPASIALREGWKAFIPIPRRVLSYDDLLYRTKKRTSGWVTDNLQDIDYLLHHGVAPPKRKSDPLKGEHHVENPFGEKIKDIGMMGADLLNIGMNKVGRGVFSKSDPRKNEDFIKYIARRNEMISSLLWKMNVSPSSHAMIMEKLQKEMETLKNDPDYMLDPKSFEVIMKSITDEIKAANLGYDTQCKNINDTLNALNKAMYEDVKDKTKRDDAKWKYRVLQGFLMVAPFMGIAYMTPFLGAFEGVFFNVDGLGAGVASLATSEHTGIFGAVADAMGIDNFIEFLLTDVPIIKDLVNILNYLTQNSIFSNVATSIFLPVAGGQVMSLVIPAVGLVYGGAREIEDWQEFRKKFKGHDKKLADAIKNLQDNMKNHEEKRKTDFTDGLKNLIDGKIKDADTKITDIDKKKMFESGMKALMRSNLSKEEIAEERKKIVELVKKLGEGASPIASPKREVILSHAHKLFDDFHRGPNTTEFVNNIERVLEEAYYNRFRAEFWQTIYNMDKPDDSNKDLIEAESMRKLLGNEIVDKLIGAGIIANGELNTQKMLEFLTDEKNKDLTKILDKTALIFCAGEAPILEDRIQEVCELMNSKNPKAEADAVMQRELQRQEFIVSRANRQGIIENAKKQQEAVESYLIDEKAGEIAYEKLKILEEPTAEEIKNRGYGITLEEVQARKIVADQLQAKTIEVSIANLDKAARRQKGLVANKNMPTTRPEPNSNVIQLKQQQTERAAGVAY